MKFFKFLYYPFRDLFLHITPVYLRKEPYHFGFLIHPRDERDVVTKYPILKFAPKWIIRFFTRWYWPVVVTKVTGLKSRKTGQSINGFIISIPLITSQILENRPLAVKRIKQAIVLAKKMGVNIIGLGALTASVTHGGQDVCDEEGIWITTGHAYTGHNVTRNLFKLEKPLAVDYSKDIVAIVGAAGSIGSISAELIARRGYKNIILVDIERKKDRVEETREKLEKIYPDTNITTAYEMGAIKEADFIIAATNTPEALITVDSVKSGAVIIDDAQPSDVHYDVLLRPDILAIEAGVVNTPGINSNFNLGLKGKHDNFCCMAEVLILAAHEWDAHYVLKRTTLDFVDKIIEMSSDMNFDVAELQNRAEKIDPKKLETIADIRKKRLQ